jgi:hypothetical protein
MSRERQIKELATEITVEVMRNKSMLEIAETLYNKGYRKASEAVEEATEEKGCSNCGHLDKIDGACRDCLTSYNPITKTANTPSHWIPMESEVSNND